MNATNTAAINTTVNAPSFMDNTEYMVHVTDSGTVIYTELDTIVLDL